MHGMTRGTIDNRAISHILAIVNQNRPHINEDEEKHIRELLQREQERKHVVRDALTKPINRVERVGSVRRRHDPFVVRLVQVLVNQGMVQPAVDPVDEQVREQDEEREL